MRKSIVLDALFPEIRQQILAATLLQPEKWSKNYLISTPSSPMFFSRVEFEFDPTKSQLNKEKHGIDFEQAQKLWNDAEGIEIALQFKQEKRYARIAKLSETDREIWTAIFTFRSDNIRLISVRRARAKEQEKYG